MGQPLCCLKNEGKLLNHWAMGNPFADGGISADVLHHRAVGHPSAVRGTMAGGVLADALLVVVLCDDWPAHSPVGTNAFQMGPHKKI